MSATDLAHDDDDDDNDDDVDDNDVDENSRLLERGGER